jgi:F-type H+-transporting ATPase subunit delta
MLSVVATRYARALVDVVTEPGSKFAPESVLEQLRSIQAFVDSSLELRTALLSPAVSPSRKRAVMERLMAPIGVDRAVRNFLFVVIDHRRIQDLASIVEGFEALLDERMGYIQSSVSSAYELTDAQRASLGGELSRLSGKKAKLKFTIDETLLGGVVARLGSTVYDGSVRGQLERLKRLVVSG